MMTLGSIAFSLLMLVFVAVLTYGLIAGASGVIGITLADAAEWVGTTVEGWVR